MPELSATGKQNVENLARKYGVNEEAVRTLIDALMAGRGTMAQFNHPALGGMGQWSQGGMIMIGDMFNNDLKHRVGTLCGELSKLLFAEQLFEKEQTQSAGAAKQRQSSFDSSYSSYSSSSAGWWPKDLGTPASTGSQNDLHYAYFPDTRRMALLDHGRLTVFDTAEHQIRGFSQQQSAGQSLSFESQLGLVKISELRMVAS